MYSFKKTEKDPGFGSNYQKIGKRLINKNGSFNVKRVGVPFWVNTYQFLININWVYFIALITAFYCFLIVNFGWVYYSMGVENFYPENCVGWWNCFSKMVFFSSQTFTTVGYGVIAPLTTSANVIASLEALTGLLFFALATGLLYGRFSKPNAKLIFSKKAVVSDYKEGKALMFKVANLRNTQLVDMKIRVMVSFVKKDVEGYHRSYYELGLERKEVLFFPLPWTVVHPINEKSPLEGLCIKDFKENQMEVLILISGFDDTFSQNVHTRYSYTANEIELNQKFKKNFYISEEGEVILRLDQMNDFTA